MSAVDETRPDLGYCYAVPHSTDGVAVHTATCVSFGRSWSGPNPTCVHPPARTRGTDSPETR